MKLIRNCRYEVYSFNSQNLMYATGTVLEGLEEIGAKHNKFKVLID
jgi:hypothetical protein